MSKPDRLLSTATGTITGANSVIEFFHGLQAGNAAVAPDEVKFDITQSEEAGSAGATVSSAVLTPGAVVPVAGQVITIAGAVVTETWTYRVLAALPFEITIGTTVAACLANAALVINNTTRQCIYADVNAGTLRIRGSAAPGKSTLEFGVRDLTALATNWAGGSVWGAPVVGAGTVAGSVKWSLVYSDSERIRIRLRGMEQTDSLTFKLTCIYNHSYTRSAVPAKRNGVDGAVNLAVSLYNFTSAGGAFVVNHVIPGDDQLVINDPVNTANNGVYPITSITATVITSSRAFKATQAGLTWSINRGAWVTSQDNELQVPFDLPSDMQHSQGSPATDVDLPGQAIETAEIADLAVTPGKCSFMPTMDVGRASSFCAHFTIGAFPQGQTIQIAMGDVWTGAVASNPAAREFQSGAGAAADLAAFVAAVNDAASPSVATALDAGGDTALLVAKLSTTILAPVSSHANCVTAGRLNPTVAAAKTIVESVYVVDGGGVDIGFLAAGGEIMIGAIIGTATAPRLKGITCTTAAGAIKTLATVVRTIRALAGNRYAICLADAGAVLANDDIIEWVVEY